MTATGPASLVVDEHLADDGAPVATALVVDGDGFAVVVGGQPRGRVAAAAVVVVLRRYGRPLEAEVAALVPAAPSLALGGGRTLARLFWRAAVDASGRDWLVLTEPGLEPVAALTPGVGAALRHLAR
ncbi:MAG: hypothetical protein R3B06_17355 [Kofleriaceae bacterium]